MPLVVADNTTSSASVSDIIDAIHYADEAGAQIMNCSWGAATYNYALKDAMAMSEMLFVCAADNNTENITYPAEFGLDNVISVGSLNLDSKADIRFASTNISATGPNNAEGFFNGTSYATAFITSAMAYLHNAAGNSCSAPVIVNALRQTIYCSDDETRVFFFDKVFDLMLSYARENQYIEYLNDITTAQNRAISNEIKAILVNDFDNLSDEDFSVIAELFRIDPGMRGKLESLGCPLSMAVAICVLANQLDITTEVALDNYVASDNYDVYKQNITSFVEIQELLNYSNEAAQKYAKSLGSRRVIDIVGAIITSNVCGIDFETIVNPNKNAIDSIDFSSPFITEENRDAYLSLLLQFNLKQNGLDSILANGHAAQDVLSDVEAWQKSNNFYITDTNVYLNSANASDIQSVHNKYQMPSSHNIMDDVSVSDLYGMMTYSKNLISLSGKNGLDLDLSLRYDEDDAISNNEYGDLDAYNSTYCALYTVDIYWTDNIAADPVYKDTIEYGKPYTDPSLHMSQLSRTNWTDGSFTYIVKNPNDTRIVVMDSGYSHIDGTRTESFYQERYSLGAGWTFNFPAIENNRSGSTGKMVLHFSDGQKYTINPTTLALEGYAYKDITFSEVSSSVFTSGGRSSKWVITYKDGRRDFIDATGRYIGSAGKDIGTNTERIEVHYNSDGYVSEIIDTVGRRITLDYNYVEVVNEELNEISYRREIDFKFFDKDSSVGTLLYKITQYVDWTMACYTICWLTTFDENVNELKSIRYAYDVYDTSLGYNLRGSYIPGNDEGYKIYSSMSSVLGAIYYSTSEYEDVNVPTIIEYEDAYRTISDASVAVYPRVKSIYNVEYGYMIGENAEDVIKNKQEYIYEVTGSSGTVTDFIMNAWNDINGFNDHVAPDKYGCVFYPKSTGYTYSVTMKQTVDSNGNYQKATTNFYNDDRQMEKVCVYSLSPNGNKALISQTKNSVVSATTQKRTTIKYGSDGAEHVAVYEAKYDDYTNIIESHSYTGTSVNSGTIQNVKHQEDVYRTFGANKYIPLKEETVACDATGLDKAYRVISENTIAPSGNDILKQRIYTEDEFDGSFILAYKDIEYTYDSNYFNVLKEQVTTKGYDESNKTTRYVYDSKYGIFRSEIIYGSEITAWGDYEVIESEDLAHHYYEYDKFGRTVKYENGDASHTTTYAYDNLNTLVETVYPDNSTSTSKIDYTTNTVIETGVDGSKIKCIYDFFGQLSEEYIFDGEQYRISMRYEYDNNNRLTATYQYLNEDGTDYVKAAIEYDGLDRVVSKKTYNKDGDLLSREDYAYSLEMYNQIPCEKVLTTTYNGNELNRTIEYFDSSGNLVCEKNEYAPNQYYANTYTYSNYGFLTSAKGDTIDSASYIYDPQGNLLSTKYADGTECQYGYDGFSRLSFSCNQNDERNFYFYDAMDNFLGAQTAFDVQMFDDGYGELYPENLYAYKIYRYDSYGNLIYEGTQNNDVLETETYSEKFYTYDCSDRLVMVEEKIDENNSIYAQYYYDVSGHAIREYTGLSAPLTIEGLDQVIDGADSEYSITKYTYDYRGNLASCTHPDGTVDTYTYSFNNLLLAKEVNGTTVVRYTYDKLGRTLSEYVDADNYRNYSYDALGNLISAESAAETISYTYDYLGNPLTETRASTTDSADYVKTCTYVPRGLSTYKLDLINDSTNAAETKYYQQYTYDNFGRLTSTVQKDNASAATNYTIDYTYDPVGRVTSQTTSTPSLSTTKSMTYNALGLVKSSAQTSTDNSINISETYTYRYDGNMIEKAAGGVTTKYTYDNANRLLKEESYNGSTLTGEVEYGYDDSRNCVSKISSDYSSGTVVKTDALVYNSSNQLILKSSHDSITGATDTYAYTYDDRGNCTGYTRNAESLDAKTVVYRYDAFNQFVGQETDGVQNFAYAYDIFGQRVAKTVGAEDSAATTNHYWLSNTIILDENANTGNTASYVFGNGISGLIDSGHEYVYGTNAHGDVTSIIGATESGKYTYDAYGNITESSETLLTTSNPYRYGSYYFDEESGLYYLNARYYDAQNGRFTQRDTYIGEINSPSTLNLYVYTAGNPIYYTDPTGHWFDTFLDIVSFGFSLYDAIKEPSIGNIAAAVFDAAALVVPFIPGVGMAKAGMKAADAADDVYDYYKTADRTYDTIDNIIDASRATNKVTDAIKIGSKIDNAADVIRGVENGADAIKDVASTTKKLASKGADAAVAAKKAKQVKNAKAKADLIESIPSLKADASVSAQKAEILARNKARSGVFEKQKFTEFATTHNNAQTQITIKTQSGIRTRVDAIGFDANGGLVIQEYKSSMTAGLTHNQQKAFADLLSSGGTVVGEGKGTIFTKGYKIEPGQIVKVIRP